MYTVLALAGCGPRLEVALATPGAPAPALVALSGPTPRSDLVVAAVDLLLRAAALTPSALEAVVASRGPGSFTGIRVALATAQGLALAAGACAHGFSSLHAQAARTLAPACLAVQPARRGFVYAQPFARGARGVEPQDEPEVLPLGALASSVLPVIAPAGLELPPETPLALGVRTTAEALLELLVTEPNPDSGTLVPLYLEPAPALPPAHEPRSWRRSP